MTTAIQKRRDKKHEWIVYTIVIIFCYPLPFLVNTYLFSVAPFMSLSAFGIGAYIASSIVLGLWTLAIIGCGGYVLRLHFGRAQEEKAYRGSILIDVTEIPDGIRLSPPLVATRVNDDDTLMAYISDDASKKEEIYAQVREIRLPSIEEETSSQLTPR